MRIHWQVDEELIVSEALLHAMNRAAECCPEVEGVQLPCAVSVRICGDETIQQVNAAQRGVDRSTDVLSFPTVNYPAGKTAGSCPELLRREYDPEDGACYLGDILISLPHLLAQAVEYGHSSQREGAYLVTHGMFHLMGYDHMEPEEQKRMRAMEEKALQHAGISREMAGEELLENRMISLALQAMKNSYSPYSHFPVGAALHGVDGSITTGCNIENASFGLTNCAERSALFAAVSQGIRQFDCIVIAANILAWPCGACRQALHEFAPDLRVIVVSVDGQRAEKNLRELLPEGFGPSNLQ